MAVPIGEAARASGVKVPTVRYYEQIGLLETPDRSTGNRRLYGKPDIARLAFIRHARELGFDLSDIRRLLFLQDKPNHSCAEADQLAKEHMIAVDRRIKSLVALKAELQRMVDGCAHGRIEDCKVIEVLADHGECHHHDAEKPLSGLK